MYIPKEQLMSFQSGLHTSRKCGLSRPMEYLAMSVRDWLMAAPNRKVPMALYTEAT